MGRFRGLGPESLVVGFEYASRGPEVIRFPLWRSVAIYLPKTRFYLDAWSEWGEKSQGLCEIPEDG